MCGGASLKTHARAGRPLQSNGQKSAEDAEGEQPQFQGPIARLTINFSLKFMTSGKAGGLKDSEPLKAVEASAA